MSFSNHHFFGCFARRVRHASFVVVAALCTGPSLLAITLPQRSHVTGAVPETRSPKAKPAKATAAPASPLPRRPYLARVGPVPLRFADPAPSRTDPPTPPVLPKPEEPKAEPTPEIAPAAAPVAPAPPPVQEAKPAPTAAPPTSDAKPLNILPDDTRRTVRPEDVLPFFQLPRPGTDASVSVAVPFNPATPSAPALPPSSATFQQK